MESYRRPPRADRARRALMLTLIDGSHHHRDESPCPSPPWHRKRRKSVKQMGYSEMCLILGILQCAWLSLPVRQLLNLRCSLPKEGERNILITSALPYCNNVPHLGELHDGASWAALRKD